MCTEYNGWGNYSTWVCNLWLTSDEYHYDLARELTVAAAESGSVAALSDVIAKLVELRCSASCDSEPMFNHMAGDLLRWAIGNIDTYEIAKAWMSDYQAEQEFAS